MTFYEAALRVLESAGRPLHIDEITEQSIAQNLLSHVGKTPVQTMLSRLSAMARRARDRRLIVTAKDTFALADWALPEDRDALAQTGVPLPNSEESLPPLRPAERHPDPRAGNVRTAGRGAERHRWREEGEEEARPHRRRFPPPAEVVNEILLQAAQPLGVQEISNRAVERNLAPTSLSPEQILVALLEDNQRRIDAGRRLQFFFSGESGEVSLAPLSGASEGGHEVQAALAAAAGIQLESGRFVSRTALEADGDRALVAAARHAMKEARRSVARQLRRRLLELDAGALERAVVRMLKGIGFHEFRVVKRMKEGPLFTTRRRDGSADLRYVVRTLGGNAQVDRRVVQEVRRDAGRYASQLALLASPGELKGEAKSEAQSSGTAVLLWCGDALAEKFLEARVAVAASSLEVFEIAPGFFSEVRAEAEEARRRREERHKEREQREVGESDKSIDQPSEAHGVSQSAHSEGALGSGSLGEEQAGDASDAAMSVDPSHGDEIEDVEGDRPGEHLRSSAPATALAGPREGEPAAAAPADRIRRRRRRRRGRRGRGRVSSEKATTGGEGAKAEPSPGEPSPSASSNGSGALEH